MTRVVLLLMVEVFVLLPLQAEPAASDDLKSLLDRASDSLESYPRLAAAIHCDDSRAPQVLRRDCKIWLMTLSTDVEAAKQSIGRYRQISQPKAVNLFDSYQAFHRLMEDIESFTSTSQLFGQQNRNGFAKLYNNFVKVDGWFGGVVRQAVENEDRCQ